MLLKSREEKEQGRWWGGWGSQGIWQPDNELDEFSPTQVALVQEKEEGI